jgi:HSP20 family protein
MGSERHYGWMWLHAMEIANEAEHLHRRIVRYLGPGADAVSWEPPVDVHESADGFVLHFALPGVTADDIELRLEGGALTVSALRRLLGPARDSVIRRLEIPHGRFMRQLVLSGAPLRLAESRYVNGCLEVRLVKAPGVE